MPNLKAIKKKFRAEILETRKKGAGQVSASAPQAVRDLFLAHFKNLKPRSVIAGTSPINDEINPMPLMQALQEQGHQLCLPITGERATPLLFRAYKIGDVLVSNVWNIGVPDESQPVCEPDVLLCPLLAFDRSGARLGYGGGYYDATLQNLRAKKPIIAVGIAYAIQEVAEVPTGAYDQFLDAIVTEKEVIVPDRQR